MTDDTLDIPRQPATSEELTAGLEIVETPAAQAPASAAAPAPVAAAPMTPIADGSVSVTCPACGTVSEIYASSRGAGDFCRSCDYPLFWAVERVPPAMAEVGDSGLRRLPGTVGRAALAALRCPACTEPNKPSAQLCVRCGAVLRPVAVEPEPEPEPVVEPEPVAEPVAETWPWWAWVAALTIMAVTITALLVALYS